MPNLKELWLGGNQIGDDGVAALASALGGSGGIGRPVQEEAVKNLSYVISERGAEASSIFAPRSEKTYACVPNGRRGV